MEGYEDGVGRPRRRGMTGEPRLFHLLSLRRSSKNSFAAFGSRPEARALGSLLFGVRWFDPLTYVFVGLVLAAAGLLAALLPAVRAARVDPLIALRAG